MLHEKLQVKGVGDIVFCCSVLHAEYGCPGDSSARHHTQQSNLGRLAAASGHRYMWGAAHGVLAEVAGGEPLRVALPVQDRECVI